MKKYEVRFVEKLSYRSGSIVIFAQDEDEAKIIAEQNPNLIIYQILEVIYES